MKRGVLALLPLIALAFALAACGGGNKSSGNASRENASRANASPAAGSSMDCNGESPVWALSSPKVYVTAGDRLYGKTKRGEYLCRSEAHAQGYQPAHHPFRHRRHRREHLQQ